MFKFVAASHEHNDRQLEPGYLLLIAQPLVGGNQEFEHS